MEMEKQEIVIPRKKSKSIIYATSMLLIAALFLFLLVAYFFDIPAITTNIPLVAIIFVVLTLPIFIWCGVDYFKQIFNENPVLIVNENGIHEQMNKYSVGVIKWVDIEDIKIIPYIDNTYWIGIVLKQPEKYITSQKLLDKLSRQKTTARWGHITFSSLYFKKEIKEVAKLMQYYFAKYNENPSADLTLSK